MSLFGLAREARARLYGVVVEFSCGALHNTITSVILYKKPILVCHTYLYLIRVRNVSFDIGSHLSATVSESHRPILCWDQQLREPSVWPRVCNS